MAKMKDSGIEWIGEIPEGWKSIFCKYIFNVISGSTPESSKKEYWDGEINWITPADYKTDDKYVCKGKRNITLAGYNSCSTNLIPKNSIIFSKRAPIGTVCINSTELCTNQGCLACVSHNKNVNIDYYYYLFSIGTEHYNLLGSGTTFKEISATAFENSKLLLPPLAEQHKIADFLDAKCSKIDALKKDITAQIEILEQYKKSVITEAVTKGLNPDVKMKDTGIEWIGEIPEHWKIQKGKYIFTQRSEKGNSIELQLLSPTQKYGVIPQSLYDEISGMNSVKLKENTDFNLLKTCHKGDYCISLRSFQGGFEYSKYEGVVSPAYQIFYPVIDIADGYFKYLFKDKNFIEKINSFTLSLRDGKPISYFDFSNMYLPLPPLAEQQQIADFLDAKCSSIDSIITAKKQQLAKLEDYKKSLIYEYVTGKKQVSL